MFRNAAIIIGLFVAISIAGIATAVALGVPLPLLSSFAQRADGGTVAAHEPMRLARTAPDPDPDGLRCREVRYSTRGVPMAMFKLVGDTRCFPAEQLPEPRRSSACIHAFYEGDLIAVGGVVLEDKKDDCGVMTEADIRVRGVVYLDPAQKEEITVALAAHRGE